MKQQADTSKDDRTVSVLGTGWLGLPLAEHLLSKGFQVKGSTRCVSRFDELKEKGIKPFVVDLSQENYGDRSFWDSEILIVNIPYKDVSKFIKLIKVLELTKVEKVIFVSSTSVYGGKATFITEEDEDCLLSSKLLEIEALFRSSSKFDTTVVRFGGLVGYSRNPALFLKGGRAVRNPLHRVNMIHRDDCVNILRRLLELDVWGEVFNCCADTHPTKKEFYTHAARVSGVPVPDLSGTSGGYDKVIDNQKIKKQLDYNFLHPDLLAIKFGAR